jgi:ankyrin repeat protein
VNDKGDTWLIKACEYGAADAVRFLVNALKADVNITNIDSYTPLMVSCEGNHISVVDVLLSSGRLMMNVRSRSKGMSAFCLAVCGGHDKIVSMLLERCTILDKRNDDKDHYRIHETCAVDVDLADNQGYAPLSHAIAQHNVSTMEILLAAGADIGARTCEGYTAFHLAVSENNVEAVNTLIDLDADVNLPDNNSSTPLYSACAKGNQQMVRSLLEIPTIDIQQPNNSGWTPFYVAVYKGFADIAQLLYKVGADINVKNNAGWTAILAATAACKTAQVGGSNPAKYVQQKEMVQQLTSMTGVDLSVRNNAGCSLAYFAATNGQAELLQWFLDADVDIGGGNADGVCPLMAAITNRHVDVVDLLLNAGADYLCKDNNGSTCLHAACANGMHELVSVLIDLEADVDAVETLTGATPLMCACSGGHVECVQHLLEVGADFNVVDVSNSTALHHAVVGGNAEIAKLLIELDADSQRANNDGMSILMVAVAHGHAAIVDLLLSSLRPPFEEYTTHGQENVTDAQSRCAEESPLHIACRAGDLKIVHALLDHGARIDAENHLRQTSLHLAVANGRSDVVRVLLARNAQVNTSDEAGNYPLLVACQTGRLQIVEQLLNRICDGVSDYLSVFNRTNRDGCTCIHVAAQSGHTDVVKFLLRCSPVTSIAANMSSAAPFQVTAPDFRALNSQGYGAIDLAVKYGHLEIVKLLFAAGAAVVSSTTNGNHRDYRNKTGFVKCPVLDAAAAGNVKMVECILQSMSTVSGAEDVDVLGETDETGSTPLMVACERGKQAVVEHILCVIPKKLLRGYVNAVNDHGMTAFSLACRNGHIEVVKILQTAGADIHGATKAVRGQKRGPENESEHLFGNFLEDSASSTSKSWEKGMPPIFHAAKNGHTDVVVHLLSIGVDLLSTDNRGFNLLFVAASKGHAVIVKLLTGKLTAM